MTPGGIPERLWILRALLLLGVASALFGLTQIRFEQYDRIRRAHPEEYWLPGAQFLVGGALLAVGAILLHYRKSAERRSPLVPGLAGPPLALGFAGVALVLHCGAQHIHGRPMVNDDPNRLVLDTLALYLLAASLAWSLFLPRGRLAYSLCLFLIVTIARAAGIGNELIGLPAVLLCSVVVFVLWFVAASFLLTARWPEHARGEDGVPE